MRNDVLVTVDGIAKKYCRSLKRALWYGLKDLAAEVAGGRNADRALRQGEFWAVEAVSFELRRGECLGLIGRNGAGKTTLLKMLNGLIKPDAGTITTRGRVGALIALGAGFNPILTGRENIYVNASVLGLSRKEIERQVDDIVAFAELDDFIDTPVQNYSSGMQVRLGFAVATALEPDIVLLDEVLAVGDAAFRSKCYNRMGALRDRAAMIFVSHHMEQVAHVATSGLFLSHGRVEARGDIDTAIRAYDDANQISTSGEDGEFKSFLSTDGEIVTAATVSVPVDRLAHGDTLLVCLAMTATRDAPGCYLRMPLYDANGAVVAEWIGRREGFRLDVPKGRAVWEFALGPIMLKPGVYKLAVVLNDKTGARLCLWSFKQHDVHVEGGVGGSCAYQLDGRMLSHVAEDSPAMADEAHSRREARVAP